MPLSRAWADQHFEDGRLYFLKADCQRYWPKHQAFMAMINDAWESLSDIDKGMFPSPDHFRKHLLIEAGYADTAVEVYENEGEARAAARVVPKIIDDYCIVSASGPALVIKRAKSQAVRAMKQEEFNASCRAVEERLAMAFGITRETITRYKDGMRTHYG